MVQSFLGFFMSFLESGFKHEMVSSLSSDKSSDLNNLNSFLQFDSKL
jgi:hypothetical protein